MATTRFDRRLAAIMAADIVGYSHLIEADEAATLAHIHFLRADVIDPLIAAYKGRVVKLMGDGALVEFGSVVDAVACAVEVQKAVAARQSDIPSDRRIILRIGINLGDVVVERDDLLGDGVNVAARLEQLCPPGGVLISGTAYDHMKGTLNLQLDYMGEQQVKNISRPVRTYSVRIEGAQRGWPLQVRRLRRWLPVAASLLLVLLVAGVGLWWFKPAGLITAKPSVAVLPFDNIGRDDATGRLADGITEDIITDLATFPEFDVVARNSTKIYGSKPADPRQVSKDLGVGYVLEGSIQRQAGQIRVTAQLIDGKTGNHLWSERWDRRDTDIFAVQTEIANQVANKLGGGAGIIQTAGREAARRKRPGNLTAYELYLLGTEKLEQIRAADNEEAIKLLTRAVEVDPEFARAWIELSNAHSMSEQFGVDRATARKRGLDAAERAVALDPRDAEAHAVLGMRLGEYGEFARTKAEFDTALSISPGSAEILAFYAGWASSLGEPQRGAEVVDRVIRLDPNYPMWQNGPFSYAYFMAGRYADVVRLLERVPTSNYTKGRWVFRAGSYAALGRADEARASVKQALGSYPDLTIESFVNDPGWSEAERQRLIEAMRAAGFPPCAKPAELAEFPKPVRLPECAKE